MMSRFEPLAGKRSCLRAFLSLLALTFAELLLPAAAQAQVSYTGTTASQNFGSQAIGSTSAATTLSFSVAAGTTVGSIGVVTQGAPNLDFTEATGGTCAAQEYASAASCTVNVTFKPAAVGLRRGALVFFAGPNDPGAVVGSVPIYGVGTGPVISYGNGVGCCGNSIASGVVGGNYGPSLLESPGAMAVDGAGNLFISDHMGTLYSWGLVEVPGGGGALQVAAYEPGPLSGMVFDGAGNLLYTWYGCNCVSGSPAGPIAPTVNGLALNGPSGLAMDGAGDLFIADGGNNRVVEVPAGGGAAIAIDPTVDGELLSGPGGLALDAAGDLFIADGGNNRVVEVQAVGGTATAIDPVLYGYGLYSPNGVAVDAAGDLFISEPTFVSAEVPAGGGAPIALLGGQQYETSQGIAVDSFGDLFQSLYNGSNASEFFYSDVYEYVPSKQAPAVNFPTITNVGSADTTDGTQTVQVQNIGNSVLTFSAISYPADFSEAGGDPNACSVSTSLASGQQCDIPIEFTPEHLGALSEDVTLTENSLNVPGTKQSIKVSGTANLGLLPALTSPTRGSTLGASNITFTWTAGTGVTSYDLWLGIAGPGSSDLYSSGPTTGTSVTVPNLPAHGVTVYARLYSEIGGVQYHTDYTFTEGTMGLAALISPAQGSVLGASNVVFTWSAGTYANEYGLWLGLSGPGSSDLYASGVLTTLSTTVPSLPANGATVYARLFSIGAGGESYNDYTFTEGTMGLAALIFPTPGSVLGASNVMFTWSAGTYVREYVLWLGLGGPGSSDLYGSGDTTGLSATVPSLPAHGAKIYARLFSIGSGGEQYNDYTFTEP